MSDPCPHFFIQPCSFNTGQPSWHLFRAEIDLKADADSRILEIAADSKYWLYVDGQLLVREGALKRGPDPQSSYIDRIELSSDLSPGKHCVAILLWHFGREGFSHNDSGAPCIVIKGERVNVVAESWRHRSEEAYYDAGNVRPGYKEGYRLPECSIGFDARKATIGWELPEFDDSDWEEPEVTSDVSIGPLGRLESRPIPQWWWGEAAWSSDIEPESIEGGYALYRLKLSHNMQYVPLLRLDSQPSLKIEILSDSPSHVLRAEYITTSGEQEWESIGWLNGHEILFRIPEAIAVLALGYRETGYDCSFSGCFESGDSVLDELWLRARRTLYVTMRDTFMDCPDRERAQWWGDAVVQMDQVPYCLGRSADVLGKKAVRELIAWQREDGALYSPVPASNWRKELPEQSLASVGVYGFWNYYRNTGDLETIAAVLPTVLDYLALWPLSPEGDFAYRPGEWEWSDWGEKCDSAASQHAWLILAWKGVVLMAEALKKADIATQATAKQALLLKRFRSLYHTREGYRSADFKHSVDERVGALAVLCGAVDPEERPAMFKLLATADRASPYMETYVLEALFELGAHEEALARIRRRYAMMLETDISTLWEKFPEMKIKANTYNHSWSGAPLTVLSRYVAGLAPQSPAWKRIRFAPYLGDLPRVDASVTTEDGEVSISIRPEAGELCIRLNNTTGNPIDWDFSNFADRWVVPSELIQGSENEPLLEWNFNERAVGKALAQTTSEA